MSWGFPPAQVRQMLMRQIYVERYLDYKFRPSVQIEPADIDAYYQKELLPELAKKNQPAPSRAEVEEQIREVLVQRGISELTAKWLDETKSRLKIELAPARRQIMRLDRASRYHERHEAKIRIETRAGAGRRRCGWLWDSSSRM